MSTRYLNIDRDTPMLLPPDLHEWVADNDLVKFVLEAVATTDTRTAQVNVRGTGSEQYPPEMMLALLIYSYATSQFSSRKIERSTYDSVAARYLCGNTHPDHDTIAKFRRENGELIRCCFVQVLELAREMGLLKMGTISLDGTKIKAAAGKRKTVTEEELAEQIRVLEREVRDRLAAAEEEDGRAEPDDLMLPRDWGDRTERMDRLQKAKRCLDERKRQAATGRSQAKANGVNTTDPDSGLMPTRQGPFIQGYNAQAVSTMGGCGGLIIGARVSTAPHDRCELAPTVQSLPPQVGMPQVILADRGYDNSTQIASVETSTGARLLCPPQGAPSNPHRGTSRHRPEHPRFWARRQREQMRARLSTPEAQALYRQRSMSEAHFAMVKQRLGFTSFHLRGLAKVNLEWSLVCLAVNCRKISAWR
jgi:transposase